MSAQTETDVLAGLDFDVEVPCEAKACLLGHVECTSIARWRVTKTCPCAPFLACDGYRTHVTGVHAVTWFCSGCGSINVATLTPIGGVR